MEFPQYGIPSTNWALWDGAGGRRKCAYENMATGIKGPKFNLQLWTDLSVTIFRRDGTGRSTGVGEFNVSCWDGVQFCNL